jgi:hypothetical protein
MITTVILCKKCYEQYVGTEVEELSIKPIINVCEVCGKKGEYWIPNYYSQEIIKDWLDIFKKFSNKK